MAITKAKLSVQNKQSALSTQHSAKATSTTQKRQPTKPRNKKRSVRKRPSSNKPSPGDLALHERTLPHRRFVEFPLVKGKIAERVQLFTAGDDNSLAIDFQDQTSLVLDIEPGFAIHAQLMRLEKGELETLAEWPPIRPIGNRQ